MKRTKWAFMLREFDTQKENPKWITIGIYEIKELAEKQKARCETVYFWSKYYINEVPMNVIFNDFR